MKHLELGCAVVRIGGFVVLIKDQQELFLLVVDDVSDECPEVVLEVELVDLMLHLLQLPYDLLLYLEVEKRENA